ncbi:MAG: IS701 family transposase [Chloroflexota bacterium]|nr:IS701 family transposase [Chloroflexota bacterium]
MNRQEQAQLSSIAGWREDLQGLHERIAPQFGRPEVRARVGRYLAGLLGPVERRNGWQLAEQLGERTPDGVQRLLNTARWDAEAIRDDLRTYVVEHLGNPDAVLVVDETGFLKKGTKSVGVQRQYSGTAGRIENCQIGVFLGYASTTGYAFLDRALYLPKGWAEDSARRTEAGVPATASFHTKGQLARSMLARAFAAGVPTAWVTGDEAYGGDGGLRRWLEAERHAYVLAVRANEYLWLWSATETPRQATISEFTHQLPADAWVRLSCGDGAKGVRWYDWAWQRLPQWGATADDWPRWVLVRRSVTDPTDIAYYLVFGPTATTLAQAAQVAGQRWMIEAGFERAKGEVGLDQYEVRRWDGWYRHITLCLLAHAFLEVTRAAEDGETAKGGAMMT